MTKYDLHPDINRFFLAFVLGLNADQAGVRFIRLRPLPCATWIWEDRKRAQAGRPHKGEHVL